MSYIRYFYQYSWVRFIVVVIINFFLTYSTYYIFLFIAPYPVAYSIAFAVGLMFTTIGNVGHTFGDKLAPKNVTLYALYYIVLFFVNIELLIFVVEALHVPKEVGLIVSSFMLLPFHFVISRWLVRSFS